MLALTHGIYLIPLPADPTRPRRLRLPLTHIKPLVLRVQRLSGGLNGMKIRFSPRPRSWRSLAREAATVPDLGTRLTIVAGEAEPPRLGARLYARPDAELPEDRRDMAVDRPFGQEEALGDLRVLEALDDELENLRFARG